MRLVYFFLLSLSFWAFVSGDETLPTAQKGKLRFRGWGDACWFDTTREGQVPEFDLGHLYLLSTYDLNARWKVLVELALEKEYNRSHSNPEREVTLERGFLQFKLDPKISFRAGRFYTPFGIYKQRHWAFTMDTYQKPIIEENQYIPASALGFEVFGSWFLSRGSFNYTALYSDGNQGTKLKKPIDDQVGYGGDCSFNYNDRILTGVSFYRYRSEYPFEQVLSATQFYSECQFFENKFLWRLEWLLLERTGSQRADGYYTQFKWNMTNSFFLNVRYESAEDELLAEGTLHNSQLFTLGWNLPQKWKFKAEYARNTFEEERFTSFDQMALWVGHAF